MLVIYKKMTKAESEANARQIEQWFKDHPRRRVCWTDLHGRTKIRRGHVTEDLAEHTEE